MVLVMDKEQFWVALSGPSEDNRGCYNCKHQVKRVDSHAKHCWRVNVKDSDECYAEKKVNGRTFHERTFWELGLGDVCRTRLINKSFGRTLLDRPWISEDAVTACT